MPENVIADLIRSPAPGSDRAVAGTERVTGRASAAPDPSGAARCRRRPPRKTECRRRSCTPSRNVKVIVLPSSESFHEVGQFRFQLLGLPVGANQHAAREVADGVRERHRPLRTGSNVFGSERRQKRKFTARLCGRDAAQKSSIASKRSVWKCGGRSCGHLLFR